MLQTYLINLDGSENRYASAQSQFLKNNIAFVRVAAVNGHKLNIAELADYDPDKTEAYMGRRITGGEIGCFYSHIEALNAFVQSGEQYGIVFEDDFLLADDFSPTIENTIEWLDHQNEPWDLINICAPKRKYSRRLTKFGTRELRRTYYFPMLATAILWTREGAIAFLDYHKVITAPYDNALREWQSTRNRGLSIYPPIVSTITTPSDIDGSSKPRNHFRRSKIVYGYRKRRRTIVLKWRALRNMMGGRTAPS